MKLGGARSARVCHITSPLNLFRRVCRWWQNVSRMSLYKCTAASSLFMHIEKSGIELLLLAVFSTTILMVKHLPYVWLGAAASWLQLSLPFHPGSNGVSLVSISSKGKALIAPNNRHPDGRPPPSCLVL